MSSGQAIDTESISHRPWLRAPAVAPAAGSENKEKHALRPHPGEADPPASKRECPLYPRLVPSRYNPAPVSKPQRGPSQRSTGYLTTKSEILRSIRAKCLDCSCYQPVEIKNCHLEGCALWPFRMGRDPAPHPGSVRGVASRAMILDGTGRMAVETLP
jgi:hypothetical protein